MQTSQVPEHPGPPSPAAVVALQPAGAGAGSAEVVSLRRQLALRDEELRDFIENGLECMHQVDADGTLLWVNQAELDFLGYTADEYVGRNIREFHADPSLLDAIFEDLGQRRPVRNRRARLRAKDGTLRTVLINSNGVYDDTGRFVRSRCFSRGIDDLVHAEAALRFREHQQAAVARLGRLALAGGPVQDLFDAAMHELCDTLGVHHAGLCQLHADGRFSFDAGVGWPPGVVGMAGMQSTARGQGSYMIANGGAVVTPDVAIETRYDVSPLVLKAGIVSNMAVIVPGRDRPWGILAVHSTVRRDFTPDEVTFADAVAHILAGAIERKATEEALEASRAQLEDVVAQRTRQLEASNKELEAFSYSVSHDLRAPLRTISGYTSLLASKHARDLPPPALTLLEGVRKSADRLGRLIDDLLDLSRVQRVDFQRQPVDLSAMAVQVLADLAANEPDRRVEWSVEPGLAADGDARLIGVLLQNLLGNAWKFTRDTRDAQVQVGRHGSGRGAMFYVRDNGAGFDMAYATKLFQPFQRLHRSSEFEGTGIGLATVQRIVERHGGRAWAEGRPGKGAAFYFTLGH